MHLLLCTTFLCRLSGVDQVYAGVYPINSSDFPKLEESIKRVCKPSTRDMFFL